MRGQICLCPVGRFLGAYFVLSWNWTFYLSQCPICTRFCATRNNIPENSSCLFSVLLKQCSNSCSAELFVQTSRVAESPQTFYCSNTWIMLMVMSSSESYFGWFWHFLGQFSVHLGLSNGYFCWIPFCLAELFDRNRDWWRWGCRPKRRLFGGFYCSSSSDSYSGPASVSYPDSSSVSSFESSFDSSSDVMEYSELDW